MEKGIYGLAYLQYNFEKNRDIIDSYIPMVCHCLSEMQAETAEVLPLRQKLGEVYGIKNITDGAVISIFERMAKDKYGLLAANDGIFSVNKAKVIIEGNKKPKENLIAGFDDIVTKVETYCKKFPVDFKRKQIEEGLFHFMDQYDVDLTLGDVKALCTQLTKYKKEEKHLKYIISKYLIEASEKEPETITMMVKLAKGHALSSLICLQDLQKMNGSLKDVEIYLDAPMVFNLLDLNDRANYHLASELLQILKDNGAQFCIFEHNYNEVISTLTDARDRLATGDYDLRKSSRLLKMAHREKMSSIQIGVKIDEFSLLLENWQVSIKGRPELPDGYQEIDSQELYDIIKDVYTNKGTRNLYFNELNMLETDVESISFVYRLRGNIACTSLKNSKALLLTTNRVISTASHDKRINYLNHAIPACSTDVFLSTILWTNYPKSNDDLNQKLLMSECYNGIELDDQLMIKFYEQLKQKQVNGQITEAQYLQVTTSNIALGLLADKTLNDVNAYTDRTTSEILEIIDMAHNSEMEALEARKNKEIADIQNQTEKKHTEDKKAIDALQEGINTHHINIKRFSNIIASIIISIIVLGLLTLFVGVKFYPEPTSTCIVWVSLYWIAWLLVCGWAVFNWAGFIPLKIKVHHHISEWVYKIIMGWLNKKEK
jgi:hypothetical protein